MADEEIPSMPSITLDSDDIVDHRSQRPHAGQRFARPVVERTQADPMLVKAAFAVLAVLVLGILAGAVFLYKQIQLTEQNLAAVSARVDQVEARLASTDTTITKSEVLLAAKLKAMDEATNANKSDIRRLWVASDKNSKAIEAGASEIRNHQAALKEIQPQLQQTVEQVASIGILLKSVDATVKEAVQRMEIVQENVSDLGADTKALKEKQSSLESDLGKRVGSLEDTAKSTDVFRRNTQDELRRLKEEVTRQQQAASAKQSP